MGYTNGVFSNCNIQSSWASSPQGKITCNDVDMKFMLIPHTLCMYLTLGYTLVVISLIELIGCLQCSYSYLSCIIMTPYLISSPAALVEMVSTLQLDLIGLFFNCSFYSKHLPFRLILAVLIIISWFSIIWLSNILRLFSYGVGSEGQTLEATKSPNRYCDLLFHHL